MIEAFPYGEAAQRRNSRNHELECPCCLSGGFACHHFVQFCGGLVLGRRTARRINNCQQLGQKPRCCILKRAHNSGGDFPALLWVAAAMPSLSAPVPPSVVSRRTIAASATANRPAYAVKKHRRSGQSVLPKFKAAGRSALGGDGSAWTVLSYCRDYIWFHCAGLRQERCAAGLAAKLPLPPRPLPTAPGPISCADYKGVKYDLVLSSGFLAFANHSGFLQAGMLCISGLQMHPVPCCSLTYVLATTQPSPFCCPQLTMSACRSTVSWAPRPAR